MLNVIIEDAEGNRRIGPAQGRLKPGEKVVGFARDEAWQTSASTATVQRNKSLERIKSFLDTVEGRGFNLGDRIAFLTDALGIEKCPRCEVWQKILNRVNELGWWKAVKLMYQSAKALRK